jgi:hypothetical protein
LPSYVDDVLEYADLASLPATGAAGKIYVTLDTNKIYRWSGTVYVEVSPTVGVVWGAIAGTLSNQTDLQSALDSKQATITLTTLGTSGAATFIGNTLNIPQYQGGVTSFNTRTGAIILTSSDVTTALTFTPYNSTNPSNYIALTDLSSAATGLSYNNATGVFNFTAGYSIPTTLKQTNWDDAYTWVAAFPTQTGNSGKFLTTDGSTLSWGTVVTAINWGAIGGTLSSQADLQAALDAKQDNLNGTGFVKASGTTITYDNSTYLTTSAAASTYQPLDGDLTAIAAIAGTSGLLRKTAANTWSLDTNTYLTGITSGQVTAALGYTPVTDARTLTINGTTYDLTANRSWTISAGTTLNGTGFVKASGTTISYDNSTYVPTNGTGATGTWGISVTGSAGSVAWANVSSKPQDWLNQANLISTNPPNTLQPSGFYQDFQGAGNPTGTWMNYINVRHGNTANGHGFQAGMSYYDNNFWVRSYQGSGTYQNWNRLLGTNTDTYPSNMDQYVRTSDAVQFGGIRTGGSFTGYHASFKPTTNVTFNIGQSTGNIGVAGPFLNATRNGISDTTSVPMFFNGDTFNWFCNYDQKMKLESQYGDLFLRGYIYQGNTNWSDLRMKQNLKKIEDPLNKIKSINGYTFEWREWTGYRNTPEILERINDAGLIAQEVKAVLPEIVENDIRRDQMSLNYNGIIALHTEGIKQLIAENEALSKRVLELESKLL